VWRHSSAAYPIFTAKEGLVIKNGHPLPYYQLHHPAIWQGEGPSFQTQFIIMVTALAIQVGVASIPCDNLVAIRLVLAAIGLPVEGIDMFHITDTIQSIFRISLNVSSDSCSR
jgi:hypothetical protein